MARERDVAVVQGLCTLFEVGTVSGKTDGQLLELFATRRGEGAEQAFAALVDRHGPMVFRVCRGVLRDHHDAQDAFQATFLVLARQGGTLWVKDSLGPWLHRIACRLSLRARDARKRRRIAERTAAELAGDRASDVDRDDLGAILHEEIDRLPRRSRAAIILCDLEGRTYEEVARHLGCPLGTVKSRLARGRERLRARLTRRRAIPFVGILAAGSLPLAGRAEPPARLFQLTVQAALRFKLGGAEAVSEFVIELTMGGSRTMRLAKWKVAATMALAAGACALGVGLLAQGEPPDAAPEKAAAGEKDAPRAADREPPSRSLRFPIDRALGILYAQSKGGLDLVAVDRGDHWRRLGEARGVVRVPAEGLIRLDISGDAVSDLSPLGQLAPGSIQVLRLHSLGAGDDVLRHVGRLKGLKGLDLEGNFITDEGIKHLDGLDALESVSLHATQIGDEWARQLSRLGSLRRIDLSRTRISDESLRHLGRAARLEYVGLWKTATTDRGLAHLKGLANLRSIQFGEGLSRFREARLRAS